ncbi:MAG TPA: SDR family oxidoreductase [Azonexus sp.]|nr:SDR family oxidoreductase [Azonexus sp.]
MSGPNAGRYRAVLSGATGGIGQQFALALAPECSAMLLVGRDGDKLATLRQRLQGVYPDLSIDLVAADLSTEVGRTAVFESAKMLPGGANLLVNNAGISDFHAFAGQNSAVTESLLTTNLLSPILLCQKFIPLLLAQKEAQIINVGSVFGDIGYPGFAVYCASKFGLRGFTQALRRELSDSALRVRYFAPRATRTGINSSAVNAMNAELKTQSDEPKAVAQAFMDFLGSHQNERILGWPEKFYVVLNRLRSQITDKAIGKQLAVIKRHLPS